MEGNLPTIKKIKTPIQIFKNIYMFDLIFLLLWILLALQLEALISPYLKYPYYIATIAWGFFLTRESQSNQGKRNWQSIIFYLIRDTGTYTDETYTDKQTKGEPFL